jgi:general secretion pathway protein D
MGGKVPSRLGFENGRLIAVSCCLLLALNGCASFGRHSERTDADSVLLEGSYLAQEDVSTASDGDSGLAIESAGEDARDEASSESAFELLRPLPAGKTQGFESREFERTLSTVPSLELKVGDMPIAEFIHYMFGELLGLAYIIDPSALDASPVTLASGGLQSPLQAYQLAIQVLDQNDLLADINDGMHLIYKGDPKKRGLGVTVNMGRDGDAVPVVAGEILQVVPLKYGQNISLERTISQLLDVKVTLDADQNALFLRGKRKEVIRALSFIEMFDAPANRGRHIGVLNLTYVTSEDFSQQVVALMQAEGIPVGTDAKGKETVVVVPLPNIGSTAVFASSEELLDRVRYWATFIDQPAAGSSQQYFVFNPQFARASEIGASLAQLMGATSGGVSSSSVAMGSRAETTGQAPSAQRSSGFQTDSLRMVVVEASNSMVFYTSGTEYQRLLPLLKQLDILPKQVLLDIVIAEVSLKDEFKFGFEWALQESEVALSTLGAFGANAIGGTALAINGTDGELVSQLLQTSQLIKVLSNPTMLVRDGSTASISVGSDISVVGSTTFDPINGERQTTNSVYRQTGVDVSVTPTINAEGVILMSVDKTISNAIPNSTGAAGNPDVFERALSTEVVAGSGQTLLLGGLISEDVSSSGSGTPGLSSIPGLGWLFKAEGNSGTRTELVMLITARILDDLNEWEAIEKQFSDGLRYLDLSGG